MKALHDGSYLDWRETSTHSPLARRHVYAKLVLKPSPFTSQSSDVLIMFCYIDSETN